MLFPFQKVFFIILNVMLPWILFSVMHLFLMSVNGANYLVVDEKSLSGMFDSCCCGKFVIKVAF